MQYFRLKNTIGMQGKVFISLYIGVEFVLGPATNELGKIKLRR